MDGFLSNSKTIVLITACILASACGGGGSSSSPTPTVAPSPVSNETPTPVLTATPTPAFTATPTPVSTETPTPVSTETPTPVFTATPSPVPTATPGGSESPANTEPSVSSVQITGDNNETAIVGNVLHISYVYGDPENDEEGDSLIQWYRNGAAISGAMTAEYFVTSDDIGTDLNAGITPIAESGVEAGSEVFSSWINIQNSAPTVSNVFVIGSNEGDFQIWDTLSASYAFSDPDLDQEGETRFRWLRNETELVGSEFTYTLQLEDNGQTIVLEIIPISATGNVEGDPVVSPIYNITNSDFSPNTFIFTDQSNATIGLYSISNVVTVSGIDIESPISIENGEYRINGGEFTSVSAQVSLNDRIEVRLIPMIPLGSNTIATLTIGGVSGNYLVSSQTSNSAPYWESFEFSDVALKLIEIESDFGSIAHADFDGDGDEDLVIAPYDSGQLLWLENNGENTPCFTQNIIPVSHSKVLHVFSEDMDGDEDVDIVVYFSQERVIAWYENDGQEQPSFTEHEIPLTLGFLNTLEIADLDSDGDKDIVFIGNDLYWLENDNLTFTEKEITTNAGSNVSVSLVVDYIDDDAHLDIVFSSLDASLGEDAYPNVYVMLNNGEAEPNFTKSQISGWSNSDLLFFSGADFDDDGDIDIVGSAPEEKRVVWYENTFEENQYFSQHLIYSSLTEAVNIFTRYSFNAKDIDGDGDLDFATTQPDDNTIAFFENRDLDFLEITIDNIQRPADIEIVDLNNDGNNNLLVLSFDEQAIYWTPIKPNSQYVSAGNSLTFSIPVNDEDNNAILYTVSGEDTDYIGLDSETGLFTFSNAPDFNSPLDENGDNVYELIVIASDGITSIQRPLHIHVLDPALDTDGDGVLNRDDYYPNDSELTTLADTNAAPYWLDFEVGDTPETLFSFTGYVSSLRYADLNNNGHQDLIASSEDDNRLIWLENDGMFAPAFSHHDIVTSLTGPRRIVPVDFNSDSYVDFVVTFSESNSFAWYENNGAASPGFTEHLIEAVIPSAARDIKIKDLDSDGDLDIIFTDENGVMWLENSGDDVTFTHQVIRSGLDAAFYLEVDYFDRDEYLDVAVSFFEGGNNASAKIGLYINNGAVDPVFEERTLTGWGDFGILSFAAADINNDGDLDIVGSTTRDGLIGWYENKPPCFCYFDFHEIDSSHEGFVGDFSVVDVDGDGDLDFSVSHVASNQIVFYDNDNLNFSERILTSVLSPTVVFPVDLNSDGSNNFIFGLESRVSWLPQVEHQYYVSEGNSLVFSFLANDIDHDSIVYSIEGADSHLFSIDPDFGVLAISEAPSFDSPEDSDIDNIYRLNIVVSDGIESITKQVAVNVLQQGIDTDGDGTLNENDAFPNDPSEWQDNDSDFIGDNADADDDNDLVADTFDNAPLTAGSYSQPEWDHTPDVLEKISLFEFSEWPRWAQVKDINADGFPDVVVPGAGSFIHVFFNSGETPVQFSHETIGFESGFDSQIIDVDGDGDEDIVVLELRGKLSWFENDGESIPEFTEYVVTTEGRGLTFIVKDIDGDDDVDIVTFSRGVVVYRSDGATSPSFTEDDSNPLSMNAFQLTSADFDLDGDLDLATGSLNSEVVAWLENDGGTIPQFSVQQIVEDSGNIRENSIFTLAGDLNRDGYPDIISGSKNDYQFVWLENSASPEPIFERKNISTVFEGGHPREIVDIDNDGDLDIIVSANYIGGFSVQLNDGKRSPSFSEQVLFRGASGGFVNAVGDLNLDGHLDFVSVLRDMDPSKGGAVYWFPNRHRYTGVMEGQSWSFTESATDEDGDTLVYSISGSDASFYEVNSATGQLTFVNAPSYATPLDANGDNAYDIEVTVTDGFTSRTRLVTVRVLGYGSDYDSDGTVNELDALPLQPDENVDTDGDRVGNNGDQDDDNDSIIDSLDNAPLDARSAASPTWMHDQSFSSVTIAEYTDSASSVAIEDLDGDGDEDVIVGSFDSQTLHWLENDGAVTPAYTQHLISENSPMLNVKAADMDDDGDMDLVVSNHSTTGATIVWYENDGEESPSFTSHVISELDYPARFSIGDIDSDDDLDIISTFYSGAKTIYLYKNNGQLLPEFNEEDLNVSEQSWYGIEITDVNNDGYLDFVANSSSSSSVSWFENNGEIIPTFNEQQILSLSEGATSPIVTVDLNGDGSVDILSGAEGDPSFYHLLNDTLIEPRFTSEGHSTFIADEIPVATLDYNFDGRMDVLTIARDSGVINLLVNRDDGDGLTLSPILGSTPLFTDVSSPFFAEFGDLNNDGIIDIVVPDRIGSRIFILNQPHFLVPDGQLDVAIIEAEDADDNAITFSITGGNDPDLFSINEMGQLSFIHAPSYVTPLDHDGNNVYDLRLEASDGFSFANKAVFIKVTPE